jgi:hypothetical protein
MRCAESNSATENNSTVNAMSGVQKLCRKCGKEMKLLTRQMSPRGFSSTTRNAWPMNALIRTALVPDRGRRKGKEPFSGGSGRGRSASSWRTARWYVSSRRSSSHPTKAFANVTSSSIFGAESAGVLWTEFRQRCNRYAVDVYAVDVYPVQVCARSLNSGLIERMRLSFFRAASPWPVCPVRALVVEKLRAAWVG